MKRAWALLSPWQLTSRLTSRLAGRFAWRIDCRPASSSSSSSSSAAVSTFRPSRDQAEIARLCASQNVLVSARPGSGKTAAVEAIVAAHPGLRVCALLYSKQLQAETARRLRLAGYGNCDVHTLHGMGGRLLGRVVPDDAALARLREATRHDPRQPTWSARPYDVVVLDEFQDCTPLLFWLVCMFVRANNAALQKRGRVPARLVVLGDERQCIYGFRDADARFLTLAPDLFAQLTPYPFARVPLHRSFRLPAPAVAFVNDTLYGGRPVMTSSKAGPRPLVVRGPIATKAGARALLAFVAPLVHKYGAANTAFLAPSVRFRDSPLQVLVNALRRDHGVPIAVPLDDESALDDRVVRGKLCVSSTHQFKGRERDLVLLFDVDATYHDRFARHERRDRCPNAVFVAVTRARAQLVLVHNDRCALLPCMDVAALHRTADVVRLGAGNRLEDRFEKAKTALDADDRTGLRLPKRTGVTAALRFVPDPVLDAIVARELDVTERTPPLPSDQHLALPSIVGTTDAQYEATSDLNGMVVAAAFEHATTGGLRSVGIDAGDANANNADNDNVPLRNTSEYVAYLSRAACLYDARVSGYTPRYEQLRAHAHDWIRPRHLAAAVQRLCDAVATPSRGLAFEVALAGPAVIEAHDVALSGQADVVVTDSATREETLWELKFVQTLTNRHVVQAATYAFLHAAQTGRVPRTVLFNARDGASWALRPRDGAASLARLVEAVLRAKYTPKPVPTTAAFVAACHAIVDEVLANVNTNN